MKPALLVVFASLIFSSPAHAGDVKAQAVMAKDENSEPTDTLPSDTRTLRAFFRTQGTVKGDKLKAIWIAEDVGEVAPKNTEIDQATLTADQDNFYGAFLLTKPTGEWPTGEYRVDIYAGDKLVASVRFSIKSGEHSSEKPKQEEKEKPGGD